MRTVPSLCAFGAGIALGPSGLAVVREPVEPQQDWPPIHSRSSSFHRADMTSAVSPALAHNHHHSPRDVHTPLSFQFSTPPPLSVRAASDTSTLGSDRKTRSGNARVGQKRTLTPQASFNRAGLDRPSTHSGGEAGDGLVSRTSTPSSTLALSAHRSSWMRQLSSTMSTSRDSESRNGSRPSSAALSNANGSPANSDAGLPDRVQTPASLPPNKLVKRSSSLYSSNGSPLHSSASRLPLPIFRRPSTSHQRSAAWSSRPSTGDVTDRMSIDEGSVAARDSRLRHYFTPKVSSEAAVIPRRRHSTGIPNPIKRVYPDRRYIPVLVSARELITRAPVETDEGFGGEDEDDDGDEVVTTMTVTPAMIASSPLPSTGPAFQQVQSQPLRRSFSIGRLLSNASQVPSRPSPKNTRAKTPTSTKLLRRTKQRVVSAPQEAMGGALSRRSDMDSEPPSKRRDLSESHLEGRAIYSAPGGSDKRAGTSGDQEVDLQLSSHRPQSSPFISDHATLLEGSANASLSPLFGRSRLSSRQLDTGAPHPARLSATRSEFTSTIGSDSDKSIGDASTDYQSDVLYDSLPTRTTRSSLGKRGPHIETIFDESPPQFSSGRSTRLRDLLDDGTYGERVARYRHSTIEEEESLRSTPHRSVHDKSVTSTPSGRPGASRDIFGSSPPLMSTLPDPDDIDWDAPEESIDAEAGAGRNTLHQHNSTTLPFRLGPILRQPDFAMDGSTPHGHAGSDRARLFDWSEVQPSPSHTQTPPRPKTVHGKKDVENRGSRTAGRRAPSTMHARSHSVPVIPDVDGKRNNVVANKFGTWGVGSKAVTEDWNEDFEFDELSPAAESSASVDQRRVDSGHHMFVPKSIREQQDNVVANIGLLREWGLLIEELKELRIRAVTLDMLNGPYAADWEEVDAMIDLADQETEEVTLQPRPSPPSSPGFDYSAFEEPLSNIARTTTQPPGPPSPEQTRGSLKTTSPGQQKQPATPGRPRKDSEAVARSVIAAIQAKRSVADPELSTVPTTPAIPHGPDAFTSDPLPKKVPFDTATLRHIVPYVSGLKRKIKNALRETEGLYLSPRRGGDENQPRGIDGDLQDEDDSEHHEMDGSPTPGFPAIQASSVSKTTAAARRQRRQQAVTDNDGFAEDTSYNVDDEQEDVWMTHTD